MAIKYTLILYGGDIGLQSIKKKQYFFLMLLKCILRTKKIKV